MALAPFQWGQGGQKLTPAQVAQRNAVAEQLLSQTQAPTTFGGGLARIGDTLRGIHMQNEATSAAEAGRAEKRQILDALMNNPDPGMADIAGALSNEWVSSDPGSAAVIQALLGQEMQENDPLRQLQLEKGQLELEQMQNPPGEPMKYEIIDGQVVAIDPNANTASSIGDFGQPEPGFRQLSPEEAVAQNLDPAKAWQVGPDNRIYEVGGSGVTVNNNMGDSLTPGQKKIDEQFADTYLTWTGGGFADAGKQLSQLNESLAILETEEGVTGAVGVLPEVLQPFINERGTIARENVEEVVQRTLRETLGAQFTEREGERLIARAFNPKLPPRENAKRVRRLIDKVQNAAEAKQEMVEYFEANGTLQGYKGRRPNPTELTKLADEFEREDGGEELGGEGTADPKYTAPEPPQGWGGDPSLWKFMTPEDRALW